MQKKCGIQGEGEISHLYLENRIVQRTFYLPSAVRKRTSHMSELSDGQSKPVSRRLQDSDGTAHP